MNWIDWFVLIGCMGAITVYGYRKLQQTSLRNYLVGAENLSWYQLMFSVIATQASAITFLSAPGQAYTDGLRFIQFYFGMPLALIVVSAWFLPRFHSMNIFTAYEYLEKRFDVRVRILTAVIFLVQRSLASALTVYAPAIILTYVLGIDIWFSIILMGGLVIAYTLLGGADIVAQTQFYQMLIILLGMGVASAYMYMSLPEGIGMHEAMQLSGRLGRINPLSFDFNIKDKYNLWSGLIGGFFLALSYFGTDQSQVARYLSGKNLNQSRLGLLMTGVVKIPMQFFILLSGILLFTLYHFENVPVFFNPSVVKKIERTELVSELHEIENSHSLIKQAIGAEARNYLKLPEGEARNISGIRMETAEQAANNLRLRYLEILHTHLPAEDINDTNYIFLDYVLRHLPHGLIGLLIAMIFAASWSSTSAEINALSAASVNDIYKRLINPGKSDMHYLKAGKWLTLFWGLIIILFARLAGEMGSLIEAVNMLGSLFYGTIVGIFLIAFFVPKANSKSVITGAIAGECFVLFSFFTGSTAFLWLNAIGCLVTMAIAVFASYLPAFRHRNEKY